MSPYGQVFNLSMLVLIFSELSIFYFGYSVAAKVNALTSIISKFQVKFLRTLYCYSGMFKAGI